MHGHMSNISQGLCQVRKKPFIIIPFLHWKNKQSFTVCNIKLHALRTNVF